MLSILTFEIDPIDLAFLSADSSSSIWELSFTDAISRIFLIFFCIHYPGYLREAAI